MDFVERPLHFFLLLPGVPSRDFEAGEKRGTAIPAMGGLDGGEGGVEEREEIGADL